MPLNAAELKTVFVSDLVDSTRVVEQLGDTRAAELFRRHDSAARALLERHQGREIDKTDGFLLLFDRPISAVRYAAAYHHQIASLAEEFQVSLAARVGIHLGEVHLRANPSPEVARGAKPLEVEGLAKVMAARLMSLACARQTLLTRAAFDVARRGAVGEDRQELPLEWRSHDTYQLKGVTEPVEVCEVGVAGFAPLSAPGDSEKARRVGAPARPGILVLPFADLSPKGDASHVGDGLTDEIITSLSALEAIRVIARSASLQLKRTAKDVRMLGRELNVQYVLEGSVRRTGNSLRITTQLGRTDRDEVLWAHKYTGTLDDLFTIEENIARTIVDALRLQLSAKEEKKLAERPIPNVAAYEYYLRAKQQIYTFTAEALDSALGYLQKGEAILGDNIQLQAAIGYVYWQYFNAGIRPDPSYLEKARECAQRIFALDPDSADGHRLIGLVEIHAKGDLQETARHLKLALTADPNDTDTLFWLSVIYGFAGRSSSAYPLIERLLEIDPLTPFPHVMPGYLAMLDGDFERARPLLLEAYELDRANPIVAQAYGQLLVMSGRPDEAHAVLDRLTADAPDSFFAKVGQCYQHALRREPEKVLATVTQDVHDAAGTDAQYSWSLAQCFALAGNREQGLAWLANAVKYGNWNYPLLAERDPLLTGLRPDERFRHLMRDVRQKWLSFEV